MIAAWDEAAARANNEALDRLLKLWDREEQLKTAHRAADQQRPAGSSAVERARKWLEKEPPAVGGLGDGSGSDRCYHVAAICYEGFGLSEDECFHALQDWNSRCTDAAGRPWPWSEKELRHKIQGAAKNCDPAKRGYLLHQRREQTPPPNGHGNGHSNGHGNGHHANGHGQAKAERKKLTLEDVATFDDLEKAGAEVRWLWESWIPLAVLTAVAAEAGTGKTRFVADLCRRIRFGLPWPDGTPMTAPPDSRSLWVVADNHHDQMVKITKDFAIRDVCWVNALKADPYGGVSLDRPENLLDLEERIEAVRPHLVVIDTVGNSTGKNLCRQEDATCYYQPLQVLARKYGCAIICITHLNAAGKLLGRRALEKVRVAILLNQPNPRDLRLRLEAPKTFAKKPAPLGVTMGEAGAEYDGSPPEEGGPVREGHQADTQVRQVMEWLTGLLRDGPKKVGQLRSEAETTGRCSAKTLYRARDALNLEEYTEDGRKWWRLPGAADADQPGEEPAPDAPAAPQSLMF